MDLSIKNGDFRSYVSLPTGQQAQDSRHGDFTKNDDFFQEKTDLSETNAEMI